MSKSLNSTAVRDYRSLQEDSARALVRLLLETPVDFLKHIRTTVGKSIVGVSYGRDVRIKNQDYIDYSEHVHEVFGLAAKSYAYLVDLVPSSKFHHTCTPMYTQLDEQSSTSRHGSLACTSRSKRRSGAKTWTTLQGFPLTWSRLIS